MLSTTPNYQNVSIVSHLEYPIANSPRLGVDYAFQALAIDEKRLTFPPTLWHKTARSPAKELQQCWFPGVHGNIGGQAESLPTAGDYGEIGNNTFAWMVSFTYSSRLPDVGLLTYSSYLRWTTSLGCSRSNNSPSTPSLKSIGSQWIDSPMVGGVGPS